MRHLIRILFSKLKSALFFLFICISLFDSSKIIGQSFSFDHLTIENGLSNSNVYSIFQDNKGYMWFGTSNGLNRFDGYEFSVFYNIPKDKNSLSGNRITCINEDKDGDLIVGTWDMGLTVYHHKTDSFSQYFSGKQSGALPSNSIRGIVVENNGNIWLATLNGLVLFDKKNQRFITFNVTSKNLNLANSISQAQNGDLIIAYNDQGIYRFNTKSRRFTSQSSYLPNEIPIGQKTVFVDNRGLIWVGHEGNGLFRIDPIRKIGENYTFLSNKTNGIASNIIRGIAQDKNNQLLIAADGGGLNIYNYEKNDFRTIKANSENKNSLSTNQLYYIYASPTGALWVGTYSGGVNIYDPNKEKFFSYRQLPNSMEGLSYKSVISVCEDQKKNIWIGTDGGGMDVLTASKKIIQNNSNPLLKNLTSKVVKSIFEDKEGNLWIGTYSGGLNVINMKTGKSKVFRMSSKGTGSEHIWQILEDSHHTVWVSSIGSGLDTFNRAESEFVHLTPSMFPNGPNYNNVMAIFEDHQQRLWFGTEGGGINQFDRKKGIFKVIRHNPKNDASLSSDDVRTIFEDSKGNLWFGTVGGGLNLMKDESTFVHFTEKDGLPSNVIYGILEDKKGFLWISTQKGLSKFDPINKTFRNYDNSDGIQSNEFTYTASCAAKDGRLFFGGIGGLTAFYPDSIKDNNSKPFVYINDFLLFNKPVVPNDLSGIFSKPISETKSITLTYDQSFITLKFIALNFSQTYKNQYAYKLDKFDKSWNMVGSKREATYTNLDPGKYIFRVKACNNDGKWNEEGATLIIIITPPWYKSYWGYSLYFIIFILALLVTYRYIRERFKKQQIWFEEEKNHKLWQQQKKFEQEALSREKELVRLKDEKLEEEKSRLEQREKLQLLENELNEQQLVAEKEIIRLQQEKMEAEVSHKNKELVSLALNISHKNDTLYQLKCKLEDIAESSPSHPVAKMVGGLIKNIQNELEMEEDWKQFELHFDQVHEDFLKRLNFRFQNLKPNSLRLCAYLRMRMSSKQIATIMNTTLASIEKSRYRLREKLDLPENVKLMDFIDKF